MDPPTADRPTAGAALPPGAESAPPQRSRALGCLLELVETLVVTLILFWVIQSFVAQPFQVKQVSMRDTIEDGQYVLVDRLTPRVDGYHRGDIIVFSPPIDVQEGPKTVPFIKRIIGVAGDTVSLVDGKVKVNGSEIREPYLFKVDGTPQPTLPETDQDTWTVPPGELFVMGDHRAISSDSRQFGPIAVDSVIGRAWLRYWPLNDLSILSTASYPELEATRFGASPGTSPPPSRTP